jgi:hypothetical protein
MCAVVFSEELLDVKVKRKFRPSLGLFIMLLLETLQYIDFASKQLERNNLVW